MTKSVSTVDAEDQQLGYDAVSWLRKGLERAYSTVRVSCPVAWTHASGVAASGVCWNGEGRVDEKESETSTGRSTETRKGSAKASCARWPGKDLGLSR